MDSGISSASFYKPTTRWALQGFALLLTGTLLYLLFRPAGTLQVLPNDIGLQLPLPALLRVLTDRLPTLFHTAAFSLLTCAVLDGSRRTHALICCSWALINIVFEIGQLPMVTNGVANWAAHWLAAQLPNEQARFFTRYFLHGTFDFGDLLASGLGAALAWRILNSHGRRQ
ncbi:MAG: hypothetical protein QM808_06835 [Steroidobacteraceae bacterium]